MKTNFLNAILVAACVTGLLPAAHAQGSARVQMTHDFTVGTATLPAGNYTILRIAPESFNGLLIRNDDGKSSAFVVPATFESRNGETPELHFLHSGDAYALTEVDTADGAYLLSPNHSQSHKDKAGSAIVSGQ